MKLARQKDKLLLKRINVKFILFFSVLFCFFFLTNKDSEDELSSTGNFFTTGCSIPIPNATKLKLNISFFVDRVRWLQQRTWKIRLFEFYRVLSKKKSELVFGFYFSRIALYISFLDLALKFPQNAHRHTRYSIEAFTLIKAFSILNNAFTRRFYPGDMRHACLAFYIIYNTKNKFINTLRALDPEAYLFNKATMTTGAMQSQNYPFFGSNLQGKETTAHNQPLDFPYSPCRMQSPNYYNQAPLPNFMSPMPQGNLGQVNGYTAEPSPYTANPPITGQNSNSLHMDHQSYYSPQEASQNCSFHQYAWLKSTSSPENWWHSSNATGKYWTITSSFALSSFTRSLAHQLGSPHSCTSHRRGQLLPSLLTMWNVYRITNNLCGLQALIRH